MTSNYREHSQMTNRIHSNDSRRNVPANSNMRGKDVDHVNVSSAGSLNNSAIETLNEYERVRVVGKGAFGTAVLCKRLVDSRFVIVKEIPMLALNAGERQMALNEAKVLSKLDHHNIVRYYNSHEIDGTLLIEMEYADGGNLQEYLAQLEMRLDENAVLNFFQQMTSAIMHLHDKRIIHRDLKTANIFMTAERIIKIGDFGISKIVSTQATKAKTVIGTPYYLSPEMCEGKPYNDKTDIWGLGCILYEMACLHRTFDATNLPALVQKITKGHFAPIDGDYSQEFRELVRDMLHQEANFRPSAKEIIRKRLPQLMGRSKAKASQNISELTMKSKLRSVLYLMKFGQCYLDLVPVHLLPKIVVQKLAVGFDHMIVLTSDLEVYAWGSNAKGQLGLDCVTPFIQDPVLVHFLKGKSVTMIGAGDGFSIFSCTNGIVLSTGDGSKGCLGHGDWNSTLKPKVLEKLLCMNVSAVECGPSHVVVIAEERFAFSFGCGLDGRLGLGNEETICLPVEIAFSEEVVIHKVRCGYDGTAFISDKGKVWACGSNEHNKLGLDCGGRLMAWQNRQVDKTLVPTRLTAISKAVVNACLGIYHSAFLLDNGQSITCGLNTNGQLGRGHNRNDRSVEVVSLLRDIRVNMVSCADTFTVVGSNDNAVLCWGCRYVNRKRSKSILSIHQPKSLVFDVTSANVNNNMNAINGDKNEVQEMTECVAQVKQVSFNPEEILLLFASTSQIAKGEIVALSGIYSMGNQIYLMVSTTAPLPHRVTCENNPCFSKSVIETDDSHLNRRRNSCSDQSFGRSATSKEKMDSAIPIPSWIEKELQDSDDLWKRSSSKDPRQ